VQLDDDLRRLAQRQRGLLTTAQLLTGGVSRSALRWQVGRGWRFVLPRVVALFTGGLDAEQRLVAGCLWAGPSGQLAGSTAARWHGLLDRPDDGVVRLLVTSGEGERREGFAIRRRTRRPDPHAWRRGALTVCSPARAVMDAAREEVDPDDARALLISAVQRRRVSESELRAELEAGPVRGSAAARRALADIAGRAWSLPEADVLRELRRSRVLPRVWANPTLVTSSGLHLPIPDFWLDDVGLAGQVHSRAHHVRDRDWERTVAADTTLGEHGVVVLAVTPKGFWADRAGFRERVERSYVELRATGRRPDVRMLRPPP
jgi:hypothetical protein